VWIYFLAEKSQAFTVFKNYKNMVEKEAGSFICCLRTDRGGEFTSFEFNNFCKDHGISRQLTAAYTPQQNGVAERKNRTIMNMVRSMLSEKQVPKKFWPEAVNWTTHVLNRSPTLAVKEMTPEEAWSGVKPNVNYFRVFGCIGHVHVPDNLRKKLDDKSFQCVLLGMSEESKAYRLYNPISEKIVTSRDVVFDEN
jgi:transposase InsO family protein